MARSIKAVLVCRTRVSSSSASAAVRATSSVNASSVLPAILRARLSNARSNAGPERRTVKPWRIAFRLAHRLRSTAFFALNYSFHMILFSPLGTKNVSGRVEASARADLAQNRQMDVGILYNETFVLHSCCIPFTCKPGCFCCAILEAGSPT
jgi:hypothetical protein